MKKASHLVSRAAKPSIVVFCARGRGCGMLIGIPGVAIKPDNGKLEVDIGLETIVGSGEAWNGPEKGAPVINGCICA